MLQTLQKKKNAINFLLILFARGNFFQMNLIWTRFHPHPASLSLTHRVIEKKNIFNSLTQWCRFSNESEWNCERKNEREYTSGKAAMNDFSYFCFCFENIFGTRNGGKTPPFFLTRGSAGVAKPKKKNKIFKDIHIY